MDKVDLLRNSLLELRQAAIKISDELSWKQTMKTYDMMILGNEHNTIYSMELHHSLNKRSEIALDQQEMIKLIPIVCDSLAMKYEPMVLASDFNSLQGYRIELF